MPPGPAAVSQQALHPASSFQTGSSVGLQSVNKVHGPASPDQKGPQQASDAHLQPHMCRQSGNGQDISASARPSHRHLNSVHQHPQQDPSANLVSWYLPPHQHQHSHLNPHPTSAPADRQQQQNQQQQELLPGKRQQPSQAAATQSGYTRQLHATSWQCQQDKARPKSPRTDGSFTSPAQQKLDGVRKVAGGWEARIARQGCSKGKDSLGVHCTGAPATVKYPMSHKA